MKIWRSLYYHYIHLYRLGLLGSINESIHLQYANTAIPSVYTNRNTHRNFSQKSENHILLLRLRIFSSFASCSTNILSCKARCSSNSCRSLVTDSSTCCLSCVRWSGEISVLKTVFCSAATMALQMLLTMFSQLSAAAFNAPSALHSAPMAFSKSPTNVCNTDFASRNSVSVFSSSFFSLAICLPVSTDPIISSTSIDDDTFDFPIPII